MDYELYKAINGLNGESVADSLFTFLAKDLALAVVWLYDRTIGAILLVLAVLLSLSRVYVGTHYPADVVGGALIGIAVTAALYLAPPTRRLLETVARRCGVIWDGVLRRLARPRTT